MDVAAIFYDQDQGEQVDALLQSVAQRLRGRGLALAGAIQFNEARPGRARCDMTFEDLASGRRFAASPARSEDARGCRLDPAVLEDVAGLVASAIAPGLHMLIINRFGNQEIAGAGLRPTIEAAVALGIPVLTAVKRANLASWQVFTGGAGAALPPDLSAVQAWCDQVIPPRTT